LATYAFEQNFQNKACEVSTLKDINLGTSESNSFYSPVYLAPRPRGEHMVRNAGAKSDGCRCHWDTATTSSCITTKMQVKHLCKQKCKYRSRLYND